MKPRQFILVEGIFTLYDDEIAKMFDLKIFVDADSDLRLLRRL